ncbi:hypothetical protein SAMN04515666_101360 [Bosea lupini]|uniref:Uncharacterized protein n=1 Tax=Bosea lupini TaxID=1036779 RepID=A0A1H7GJF7_9HYPH|nr:hypothetical protein [Bosea lupini]SEK37667.1 hypothetical protein SAMN04515666_101360 [Bosea lupini]
MEKYVKRFDPVAFAKSEAERFSRERRRWRLGLLSSVAKRSLLAAQGVIRPLPKEA